MNDANNPGTLMAGLLMTRPVAGNDRFLALLPPDLRARFTVVESPLMEIVPEADLPDLEGVSAVIFTSQNGVEVASRLTESRLRALCVGAQTTDLARKQGWNAQMLGQNSGEFLQNLLRTERDFLSDKPLIHLRGAESRGAIAQTLSSNGLPCREATIYRQDLCAFSAQAKALLEQDIPLIVPLFSPRTARHFAQIAPHVQHLTLILLSDAVAAPLERLHCEARHVSKTPDARAMAQMLVEVATSVPWVERLRSAD